MIRSARLASFVLFAGCVPGIGPDGYRGPGVWRMFPLDGERTWSYVSTDTSLAWTLEGRSIGEPEEAGGTNVYNVEYTKGCFGNDPDCVDGEILFKVKWSSDVTDGVFVHASALGTDPFTDFEPPVRISPAEMKKDASVETATGGGTWTSTLLGLENHRHRAARRHRTVAALRRELRSARGL